MFVFMLECLLPRFYCQSELGSIDVSASYFHLIYITMILILVNNDTDYYHFIRQNFDLSLLISEKRWLS